MVSEIYKRNAQLFEYYLATFPSYEQFCNYTSASKEEASESIIIELGKENSYLVSEQFVKDCIQLQYEMKDFIELKDIKLETKSRDNSLFISVNIAISLSNPKLVQKLIRLTDGSEKYQRAPFETDGGIEADFGRKELDLVGEAVSRDQRYSKVRQQNTVRAILGALDGLKSEDRQAVKENLRASGIQMTVQGESLGVTRQP